jgi:hypothetical protein
LLQIGHDLAALDPEQMVPRASRGTIGQRDGENVDMAGGDLKHMSAMVEQFRVAAIEDDARRTGAAFGLRQVRRAHSRATSWA